MIDSHKLVWIRAALQYFEDELGPHGPKAMKAYLKPDDCVVPTVAELQTLRGWLATCHVEYVCGDRVQNRLLDRRLFASPEEAEAVAPSRQQTSVSVVLSGGRKFTPPPSTQTD